MASDDIHKLRGIFAGDLQVEDRAGVGVGFGYFPTPVEQELEAAAREDSLSQIFRGSWQPEQLGSRPSTGSDSAWSTKPAALDVNNAKRSITSTVGLGRPSGWPALSTKLSNDVSGPSPALGEDWTSFCGHTLTVQSNPSSGDFQQQRDPLSSDSLKLQSSNSETMPLSDSAEWRQLKALLRGVEVSDENSTANYGVKPPPTVAHLREGSAGGTELGFSWQDISNRAIAPHGIERDSIYTDAMLSNSRSLQAHSTSESATPGSMWRQDTMARRHDSPQGQVEAFGSLGSFPLSRPSLQSQPFAGNQRLPATSNQDNLDRSFLTQLSDERDRGTPSTQLFPPQEEWMNQGQAQGLERSRRWDTSTSQQGTPPAQHGADNGARLRQQFGQQSSNNEGSSSAFSVLQENDQRSFGIPLHSEPSKPQNNYQPRRSDKEQQQQLFGNFALSREQQEHFGLQATQTRELHQLHGAQRGTQHLQQEQAYGARNSNDSESSPIFGAGSNGDQLARYESPSSREQNASFGIMRDAGPSYTQYGNIWNMEQQQQSSHGLPLHREQPAPPPPPQSQQQQRYVDPAQSSGMKTDREDLLEYFRRQVTDVQIQNNFSTQPQQSEQQQHQQQPPADREARQEMQQQQQQQQQTQFHNMQPPYLSGPMEPLPPHLSASMYLPPPYFPVPVPPPGYHPMPMLSAPYGMMMPPPHPMAQFHPMLANPYMFPFNVPPYLTNVTDVQAGMFMPPMPVPMPSLAPANIMEQQPAVQPQTNPPSVSQSLAPPTLDLGSPVSEASVAKGGVDKAEEVDSAKSAKDETDFVEKTKNNVNESPSSECLLSPLDPVESLSATAIPPRGAAELETLTRTIPVEDTSKIAESIIDTTHVTAVAKAEVTVTHTSAIGVGASDDAVTEADADSLGLSKRVRKSRKNKSSDRPETGISNEQSANDRVKPNAAPKLDNEENRRREADSPSSLSKPSFESLVNISSSADMASPKQNEKVDKSRVLLSALGLFSPAESSPLKAEKPSTPVTQAAAAPTVKLTPSASTSAPLGSASVLGQRVDLKSLFRSAAVAKDGKTINEAEDRNVAGTSSTPDVTPILPVATPTVSVVTPTVPVVTPLSQPHEDTAPTADAGTSRTPRAPVRYISEVQGHIEVRGKRGDGGRQTSFRPNEGISLSWTLPLDIFRARSQLGNEDMSLTLALFRYGAYGNNNSVFFRKLNIKSHLSGGGAARTMVSGRMDVFAPKESGKFVFRIFDSKPEYISETLATSVMLTTYLSEEDIVASLERLSATLASNDSTVNISVQLSQFHSVLECSKNSR